MCFRAVAEALREAQEHGAVDSVVVVGRDELVLVEPTDGKGGSQDAARTLAAERVRPYTEREASRFLDIQRALRAALPQHRDELEEITALARALMPAALRTSRALPAADAAGG